MDDLKIGTILCSVDFSESSDNAMRYALELARTFGAKLVLLHVVELPLVPSYAVAGVPELSLPVEQFQEGARRHLERVADECRALYPDVESALRTGTPFIEIIGAARELRADMIVMGTHGRTGLRQLLIGSVAEKVVRKAPCPVLTVKHPDHSFEMP